MNLIVIVIGTLMAGVGSVWLAAVLSFGVLARYTQHMLSLAAGALLATAFLNLVPEAFASGAPTHLLSGTLLAGLVFFFLLSKAELWHHGHEHHPELPTLDEALSSRHPGPAHRHPERTGHAHAHRHAHDHAHPARAGAWTILTGDGVHCFGDGVLIASAFLAGAPLGWAATLAVLVHEVPHHMGDLAVLHQGRRDARRTALLKVSLAGAVTALGGLVGYALVAQLAGLLPYLLMLASSSFIYVALADLIPQLQQRLDARQTLAQVAWLLVGVALVVLVVELGPAHGHG
ncbi:MAG TPA: ZIP family metal transporter [Ottowia sp.]|uniref:ZIP family metal transporter n=1 Tax=Ottowia sp. TaxID=1898956 RepID=UPI002C9801F6|nr:ZIP family metal transporter [Ottowia sp.]HMN21603.1 ZIP family metal transporter [Ottowia sp.]